MNNDFYKELKSIKWVKSWEASVPLFWVDLWMSNYELPKYRKKIFGCDGNFYAVISKNKLGLEAFLDEKDVKKFSKQGMRFYKDLSKVKRFTESANAALNNFLSFTKRVSNLSRSVLQQKSLRYILKLTKKLFELHADFTAYTKIALPGYSDQVSKYLVDYCFKKSKEQGNKIYETLTTPTKFSVLDKEKIALLKIVIDFYHKKSSPDLKRALKLHQQRFGWLGTGESTSELSYQYFKERIKRFWKKERIDLIREYKDLKNKTKKLKKEMKILAKKYNISKDVINVAKALSLVADFQLDMWRLGFVISLTQVKELLQEVQKRIGINKKYFQHLTSREILDSLETGKKINIEIIKKRFPSYVYLLYNTRKELFIGSKAQSLINFIDKSIKQKKGELIQGIPVFKGVVRGRVKILSPLQHKLAQEIKRVKNGDIIVTSMTRPHLLPALVKVAGIITNEGGLTCHAAIISRELKVPTIVGTKSATKTLKDGYLIELDANQGIVKILKGDKKKINIDNKDFGL